MSAWPTVKLGEVLRLDPDSVPVDASKTYPMVGVLSFGRGLFERPPIENAKTSYRVFYRLKAEHVVMSQLFGWEGALALSSEKFAGKFLSPQFPTFLCDDTKLDREFLGWLIQRPTFWEDLGSRAIGMGDRRRTLNPEALFKSQIPLPPLPEQQRLVARIEELADQIHEAQTLRHQATKEAEALIVSTRRTLIGEECSEGWIALKNLVVNIENGRSPQCESRQAERDEWGVLKVGAISFGTFDAQENKALPVGVAFDPRYEVHVGDFLMSRANTTELVGACATVHDTRPQLLLSDKTFRFHFGEGVDLEPRWLDHTMKSPALRAQIERGATGTSPTMKNISKEKVLELLIPPHPLPEQRRIVAELDALQAEVDALKRLQAETAAELDALLPSILDKAFKGEL
jgi:type I restriction enzyme S subunit